MIPFYFVKRNLNDLNNDNDLIIMINNNDNDLII